jgi:hypothetical protein
VASEVDIVNTSLSHIGQDAMVTAIDPPDGSGEAEHAARFFPIARDELLERHAWRFALTRASLAQLADNPSDIWSYAYGLPNACVRPLAVLLQGETDDRNAQEYTIETLEDGSQALLTNAPPGCALKFITRQADTAKFTPNFVVALSWRLAAYLAGPITKDLKLKKSCFDTSEAWLAVASGLDADSEKNNAYRTGFVPGHLQARQ